MSQSTEIKDTAATPNSTMTRDSNADSNLRRLGLPQSSGGLSNLGFLTAGVFTASTSQTMDQASVNGFGFSLDCTGGSRNFNLMAASGCPGEVIFVRKSDSSVNTLVIVRNGSDTIGNVAGSLTIYAQNENYYMQSDGVSNWVIIDHYSATPNAGTVIADPGNAGAISVLRSGFCGLTSTGSDTRTLAAPPFLGQEITLGHVVDGGSVVITVASAINQTGNNTITMASVRAFIILRSVLTGVTKVWCVVASDGASLSTV